jgi:hypothetical protein
LPGAEEKSVKSRIPKLSAEQIKRVLGHTKVHILSDAQKNQLHYIVGTHFLTGTQLVCLRAILDERHRQEELHRSGKFSFTCASPDVPNGAKLMVLTEEVGEVARAAMAIYDPITAPDLKPEKALRHLQEELIQVAAVAMAWAESIEKDVRMP